MTTCSPQRYLANNRNALRLATLTPSSVMPEENSVLAVALPRIGTAQVDITGEYAGTEDATYDVQIVDTTVATNLTSAPIFSGAGSGSLANIVATGVAQTYTVELADTGIPLTPASVPFEGVTIVARQPGAIGNQIRILIDQSELVFTTSTFSLLDDLKAGDGGDSAPLKGPAYDWNTAVLGADSIIPDTAKRIAFDDDTSVIYLQYKQFVGTDWEYHFVPALARDVAKGAVVKFVTGGRTVTVTAGGSPPDEIYPDIVTDYDLLNALKSSSVMLDVSGVVALDRSPDGQASLELSLRTDAHVEQSYGSGTNSARSFADAFANPGAGTELVTATCIAVTGKDNPDARVGAEIWKVNGSLSGDVGQAVTGIPFVDPVNDFWGFTIPRILPDDYNVQKGTFSVTAIQYAQRDPDVEPPPICVVARSLGPNAVDQSLTLTYTKRPSGNCACDDMAIPDLYTACLGVFDTSEGGSMAYTGEAMTRYKDLYDWARDLSDAVTKYRDGLALDGIPTSSKTLTTSESASASAFQAGTGTINLTGTGTEPDVQFLLPDAAPVASMYADDGLPPDFDDTVNFFESALAAIDAVTDTTLRGDGFTEWDSALTEWKDDLTGSALSSPRITTMASHKYRLLAMRALAYAGISNSGKTDADSASGDGCWRDWKDPFYWVVVGSDRGAYAPAFNNHPYYASMLASDDKSYFSTHEFAFQINVKCPEGLLVGDQITLSIGNSGTTATYQVGDTLTLPVIAAQPFYLAGGQDGTSIQTWYVSGSVDGPKNPFIFDKGAPSSYSTDDLSFDLVIGGIDFEKGDQFTFAVEGAHWRWRVNGGSWSSSIAVPGGAVSLDAGLSIQFITGASPSFVANDMFTFKALQPWAVSNIQDPTPFRWQWDTADATLIADFGSDTLLDVSAIALHTLPATAELLIEGGSVSGTYTWSEPATVRDGVILSVFSETRTARYVRLTITNGEDAGIGFWWIGQPMQMTLSPELSSMRRSYKILRGNGGLYQGGRFVGKGIGGDLSWTENLLEDDITQLNDLLDWAKMNNDEPIIFVPQISRPTEVLIAQITDDDIDIPDLSGYNADLSVDRRFSAKLTLAGVWQ